MGMMAAAFFGFWNAANGQSEGNGEANLQPSSFKALTNSMEVLDDKRKLANSDKLSYRVVQERGEPRQLQVTDSGELEVPLIGRVNAAGKTCRQLAEEIKRKLEVDYFHHATVIVGLDSIGLHPKGSVYVMGAVRTQGAVEIPATGSFTVSKCLMRAGGFADFANKKKVKLVRKNADKSETIPVDVDEVLQGGSTKDPALEPDDVIIVPQNRINW
jgi:protein involved in polysaccharide export with SLBB domain